MATARQVVDILDNHFNLAGTARIYAERLRARGVLAKTQGRPAQVDSKFVAMLLISVLLGEPTAADAHLRTLIYAGMTMPDGTSLRDALARYINTPYDFFELRVDTVSPSASMTFRGSDRGMVTVPLYSDGHMRSPGVERYVVIDGNSLARISGAIANAPEVRAGRRRRHRN